MFRIISEMDLKTRQKVGKGIHIIFENGVTASIQFGSVNYCGKMNSDGFAPNCEICAWDKDQTDILTNGKFGESCGVAAYITANQIPEFLEFCKNHR